MSKIGSLLKQEIVRLARKEINAGTALLRRSNAQYRRDIAQLKRAAGALTREVSFLKQQERKRAAVGSGASDVEGKRFSPRGLKARRKKLGLSAADYARLVGVSSQTIYNWEQGNSRPGGEQLAALISIRDLGKREALKRLELIEG